jgi:hypothetical protein
MKGDGYDAARAEPLSERELFAAYGVHRRQSVKEGDPGMAGIEIPQSEIRGSYCARALNPDGSIRLERETCDVFDEEPDYRLIGAGSSYIEEKPR